MLDEFISNIQYTLDSRKASPEDVSPGRELLSVVIVKLVII